MANVVDSHHYRNERHQLFNKLKVTVERTVGQHSADILYVHGGLDRIVVCLDDILKHGNKPDDAVEYWNFVCNLNWLLPMAAVDICEFSKVSNLKPECRSDTAYHNIIRSKRPLKTPCHQWLEKSLKMRSMSVHLKALTSKESPITDFYYGWSFLLDKKYLTAMMTCLLAWEQNSSLILAEIPVELLAKHSSYKEDFVRIHKPQEEKQEKGAKKTVCGIQTPVPDPLCGIVPPDELHSEKLERIHKSLSSPPSNLSSCTENDSGQSESAIMGMHTSIPACITVCLPKGCGENGELQKLIKSDSNHHYTRKHIDPLFTDSSDDLEDDDLGFLSSSKPPPVRFQIAGDIIINPDKKLSDFTAQSPGQCIGSKVMNNFLPDVVVSAEESILLQSVAVDSFEESAIDGLQKPLICEDFSLNSVYQPVENIVKLNKPDLKTKSIFTHRRSKSDHQGRGFSTADQFVQDELPTKLSLKSSSSLPSLKVARSLHLNSVLDSLHILEIETDGKIATSHSLMNYLQKQDLTTCADIDKENAHFHFSEMLIGAIEQVKCQLTPLNSLKEAQCFPFSSDHREDLPYDSLNESYVVTQPIDVAAMSSHPSCSYHSPVGSISSDQHFSSVTSDITSHAPVKRTESIFSMPSTNESKQVMQSSSLKDRLSRMESVRTAESIAIGLLKTFSDQPQVTAGEMKWLISEEDVPQKLLPLPMSVAIDPDNASLSSSYTDSGQDKVIRIRGNQEWAPPRPQIIFHAPVKLKLKAAMIKQNYRCAGCGTLVNKAYMKRFRFCEYLGKYFCSCCHDNKLSVIPAYILHKFDFTRYKVSNFTFDLLETINNDPLFNLNDINPAIYKKVKALKIIQNLRQQTVPLYKYVQVCRFANSKLQDDVEDSDVDEWSPLTDCLESEMSSLFPSHILCGDVHVYSISDLQKCKNGELLTDLKRMVEEASTHISNCQLCQMKGFICEFCNNAKDIIFPHQHNTSTCQSCHSCYHTKCYDPLNCPKCKRINKRKEILKRNKP